MLYQIKKHILQKYIEQGLIPQCEVRGVLENGDFYALVKSHDFVEYTMRNKINNDLSVSSDDNDLIMKFTFEQ